ncbi:Rho GTPase activation protein [Hypoxylon sp. NC1633]|nr:Rho GTPase activation protein [Hypoxylon sp. NC1633]
MHSKQRIRGISPPPEVETESRSDHHHIDNLADWSIATAGDTLPPSVEWVARGTNARSNFRAHVSTQQNTKQNTIRTVTPEPGENGHAVDTNTIAPATRGFGTVSPQQASPRSIPGGERRRQGMVFNDTYGDSFDSTSSSPPLQHSKGALRPRTHTMDGALALRQQSSTSSPADGRHRVGSFSSSGSQPFPDVDVRPPPTVHESVGYPSVAPTRPPDLKISVSSSKDKRSANRRLIKRTSSRPTSPLVSPPPSVDSLPLPVPTNDANKILLLMKALCGRMKGEVEYQSEQNGPWYAGICYIDEDRGSLLFDSGQNGPFHIPVVADLRGCRVLPVDYPDDKGKCIEVLNNKNGVELLLRPVLEEEFDLWLASLLCWQQIRPSTVRFANGRSANSPSTGRTEMRRRGSSVAAGSSSKDTAIIKVGKVMLWDKGTATSPRAIVKRPSTRDLRSGLTSWRRVSCILQDNGEFKLMTENDVAVLSVIELSQLSRCAVQQLHRSVLDEEFCIAIFPIYSSTSKQLSIFRPVYLALDSRVLFEVWFVLLRAFAVPDLYGHESSTDQITEIRDFEREFEGQLFRLEKTIEIRVTEAKIKKPIPFPDHDRLPKDRDPLIGNYLAEVILDGEVRSRTTIQLDTKNPFWREFTQFTELSTALPFLSVILKRVEGNLESLSHQPQAPLGLQKTGNLTEILCGSVDIPLDKLDRAKDHEQWFQVCDENKESVGSMLVKVNHDELVVLGAKDYEPLSELLHKFSVGLTSQIALAIPSAMRRLAELFLNIFQVSGRSSEWLMALVEEEIDGIGSQNSMKRLRFSRRLKSNESSNSASDRDQLVRDMKSLAGEANLLFRGNSLLTQALEFHMRRLGKEFLEEILADKIFEINESNSDCEVDPSRIQNGEEMQLHWSQLIQLTTEVWECIIDSATKLPLELRQILKYVRAVAEDRYGDFLRTVNYTSVSGFLFLRFICPAILNPKLFGLLRDNPRPRAQRTLTLIAKGLQALANLSTFGKKESWMEPMNKFLSIHRQPFKDYIDQMCSIPTERNLVAVPASYSTPVTILGRLSPISREGFPSLPYLIDHPRNYAALVKLWFESSHRSTLNDPSDFDAELAKRSDECLARVEVFRAAENESVVTDDLAETLEKSALLDSVTLTYGNQAAWTENDPDDTGNGRTCEAPSKLPPRPDQRQEGEGKGTSGLAIDGAGEEQG